jgi:hypothetical protein
MPLPAPKIKAEFIEPMLLLSTSQLPEGGDWVSALLIRRLVRRIQQRIHFRFLVEAGVVTTGPVGCPEIHSAVRYAYRYDML